MSKYDLLHHHSIPGWFKVEGLMPGVDYKNIPEWEGGGIAFSLRLATIISNEMKAAEYDKKQERITHYTLREGGEWIKWGMVDDRVPSEDILNYSRQHLVTDLSIINQCAVRAFKTTEGRVWDCINGWRDTNDKEKKFSAPESAKNLPCTCGRWPGGDCDTGNYDLCKLA